MNGLPLERNRNQGRSVVVGLAWLLVGLSFVEVYRSAHDGSSKYGELLTGDTLFPASLYEDMFVDGFAASEFKFPAAPFWFPDTAVYFAARAVTGAHSKAVVVYAAVQFLLLIGSFAMLARAASPRSKFPVAKVAVLTSGAALLLANAISLLGLKAVAFPLMVQLHVGALIAGTASAALLITFLRGGRWWVQALRLTAVLLLVAPTYASDRLLLLWMVAPFAVATGIGWVLGRRSAAPLVTLPSCLAVWATLGAATLAGHGLFQLLLGRNSDAIVAYNRFSYANFVEAFPALTGTLWEWLKGGHPLAVVLAVWVPVSLVLGVRSLLVRPAADADEGVQVRTLLVWYYLGMVVATCGPVLSNGWMQLWAWDDPSGVVKHMLPVFFLPVLWWGLWAEAVVERKGWNGKRAAFGMVAVTAGVLAFAATLPRGRDQAVWNHYPQQTRTIDEIATRYGLKYGIGEFWDARPTTLLSRAGVRLYPVWLKPETDLVFTPMHWLSNGGWYQGRPGSTHREPRYTFVLLTKPQAATDLGQVVAKFGEPAAREWVGDRLMLIYNRPSDVAFAGVMANNSVASDLGFTGAVGEVVRYHGSGLHRIGGVNRGPDRVSSPDASPPYGLVLGPNVVVPPGRYRLTLCYTSPTDGSASWDRRILLREPETVELFSEGVQMPRGERMTSTIELAVTPDQRKAELAARVIYYGGGEVAVHHVEVERLE